MWYIIITLVIGGAWASAFSVVLGKKYVGVYKTRL